MSDQASSPSSSGLGANVSVCMITLNEEKAVAKVVADIQKVVPAAEIVICDSSSDRTAEVAQELGCVVIKQFPPKGYSAAMHSGFMGCTRDIIITLDCDDTYPTADIITLINKMGEGYDLVSASRLERKPDSMPLSNYIANKVFCVLGFFICNVKSSDLHTGMRAYRRSMITEFPYDKTGLALPVELQAGPLAVGWKCCEIFIDYRERIGETKLDKVKSTIATIKRLWRWRWWGNPQRKEVTAAVRS